MTVQSARVQSIIKGDDVVLKHQIMKDVAYDAELSRAPVLVTSVDTVKFFYPLQDGSIDLIGYAGVVIGSYPASEFNVNIAGDIPAVPNTSPEMGTKTFLSGQALTVRAEITRQSGKKESYYLYEEIDIMERDFPSKPISLNLP